MVATLYLNDLCSFEIKPKFSWHLDVFMSLVMSILVSKNIISPVNIAFPNIK